MDVLDPSDFGRQSVERNLGHWAIDNPLWVSEEAEKAAGEPSATPSSNSFSQVQECQEQGIQEVKVRCLLSGMSAALPILSSHSLLTLCRYSQSFPLTLLQLRIVSS